MRTASCSLLFLLFRSSDWLDFFILYVLSFKLPHCCKRKGQLTLLAVTAVALPLVALDYGVDDMVGGVECLVATGIIQRQGAGQVMQHLQVSEQLEYLGVAGANFHCLQHESTCLIWRT